MIIGLGYRLTDSQKHKATELGIVKLMVGTRKVCGGREG